MIPARACAFQLLVVKTRFNRPLTLQKLAIFQPQIGGAVMASPTLNAETLKAKLHVVGPALSEPSRIRIHRATSWLARAESEGEDADAQFTFLWIAFNAAYAKEFGMDSSERDQLNAFFVKLLAVDSSRRIQGLMFGQFTGPVRTLIENKFVFEPFWKALRGHDSSNRWEAQFARSKDVAMKAVMGSQTDVVLSIVFDRLYVLRNQIVHGGATWNSKMNRMQVRDGARILLATIPVLVDLMLDHPETDFGDILYPVV
jgi:hypothetical protein